MSEVNIKSPGILSQKIQEMMATNFYQMEEESQKIASEQLEYIAIVSDRYEQEMRKAISNIKYEANKAELPYLGLDLAPVINESLTVINRSEG